MAIQIFKVTGLREMTSQSNKQYTKFNTSIGDINVFDVPKINALTACIGSYAKGDIEQRGKYLNLNNVPERASQEEIRAEEEKAAVFTGNNGPNQTPTTESINEAVSKPVQNAVTSIVHEIIDNRLQDWVEVGKAGERVKIYFKDQQELMSKLETTLINIRAIQTKLDADRARDEALA